MTRNQAINYLYSSGMSDDQVKGVVEALQQEPSGDLISRAEAIKAIDEKAKRIKNEDTLNGLAGAVGILFNLPSVNPQEPTDENLHREREQAYMRGFEDASKRFRQEPCTDAVSRQVVDTLVDELARAISDERCCISRGRSTATIMQDILDLPPVNLQETKTGHWINISNKDLHDYRTGNKLCFECSECRSQYTYKSNYCPNCGMVEPQESEE